MRDVSTTSGVPYILIGSIGSSTAVANSGNTVSNNELFNFNSSGIYIGATGNTSWALSDNNIYEVNASTGGNIGIGMFSDGTNVISGNNIHDLLADGAQSVGIFFQGTGTTTLAHNRITALDVNAATTSVYGIVAQGLAGSTLNVVNNQLTLRSDTSSSTTFYGLIDEYSVGKVINVFYNSVVISGTESGTRSSWASLRTNSSTHTARNNLFLNLRTGGTGSHYAAGSEVTGGSYSVSNNVYAGTGTTPASFMDFSTTGSTVPVSFATWQSTTGETNSQAGPAGTGSFTAAIFSNAATGDLHLAPGGNPLVNTTGTPIAGVVDDYDGDPRNALTPSIGADEFVPPAIFGAWVATYGVASDSNALGANGLRNLLNFAFGIHPVTGGSGALQYAGTFAGDGTITATGLPRTWVETNVNGEDRRALFIRRKDFVAAGLTYTPQFSTDLTTWVNSSAGPLVLADDGTNQIVSVPFPIFIAGERTHFFRLSATLAP